MEIIIPKTAPKVIMKKILATLLIVLVASVAPARPDASKLQELINTQKKYLSDMDRAMIDVHDSFTSAFLKSGKENKKNDLIRTRGPFFEDLKKVYNKLSAFDLSGYDLESEEFDDLINECDTKIGELKDLNLLIKN
ncbi:uncharacterized protein [Venturia canescens]|uniref:uncharacterized protein isoform X2 n=1 Tax=Venturia canescens TaxID=32260 RepID=UPI001C9BF074|nr:uncharacterized protein LOC122412037 isoform X2 [Venturia canescens]